MNSGKNILIRINYMKKYRLPGRNQEVNEMTIKPHIRGVLFI